MIILQRIFIADRYGRNRLTSRTILNIVLIIFFHLWNFSSANLPARFVNLKQQVPECGSSCSVKIRNESSNDTQSIDCEFIKDTFECEKRIQLLNFANRSADESANFVDLANRTCRSDRVRVDLSPFVYDHPWFHASASLNVTLNILDQSTRGAAIRLICLESGYQPEYYCINRTRPGHWDQFYWPCRLFDFSNVQSPSSPLVFPLQFNNDCFRLNALSLFMINVTLYPQNCIASFVFRMPSVKNIQATDVTDWLPMLSVDTNPEDGVSIVVPPPPSEIRLRRMVVELYEELPSDQSSDSRSKEPNRVLRRQGAITVPDTSVFFKDVPRGKYWATASADHSLCHSDKCYPIQVPFNLTKDHYTVYTQKMIDDKLRLERAWVPVAAAVVGVVMGFIVIIIAVIAYLRWKAAQRKRRQSSVNFVQFTRRPVVLILYTNDFAQHRRCVLELASYLRSRANCDVEIDEWILSSASNGYRTPMEWLMHAVQRADYFLIVFSAGAKETVFRPIDSSPLIELKSERPWDETFAPAMHFILQRILQAARSVDTEVIARGNNRPSASAFNRYVCLYFSYSSIDHVPDLFRTLPCPKFQLPDELRHLICHIHEFPQETVYENCPMDADGINSSISEASAFVQFNPNWLQSRLVERNANEMGTSQLGERQRINEISAAIDRLRGPVAHEAPQNVDQFYANAMEEHNRDLETQGAALGQISDQYPLISPSANAQGAEAAESDDQFQLLAPDDEELASLFISHTNQQRSHPTA